MIISKRVCYARLFQGYRSGAVPHFHVDIATVDNDMVIGLPIDLPPSAKYHVRVSLLSVSYGHCIAYFPRVHLNF